MIIRCLKSMINPIMEIWLEENMRTHFFIPTKFWSESFDDVKRQIAKAEVWTFIEKEVVVGFVGVVGEGYLAGLFVKKEFQHRGIGRKLIEHIKSRFKNINLHVFSQNKHAIEFYRRNGFKVIGSRIFDTFNSEELEMCWQNTDPVPNFKWIEDWNKKRLELKAPFNINKYFESDSINCQKISCNNGGYVSLRTGSVCLTDPLGTPDKPFFHKISKGLYPITLSKITSDNNFIASVKLTFADGQIKDYENALRGNERLSLLKSQDYFGTYSNSGLLAVGDYKSLMDFWQFKNQWKASKNKDTFDSFITSQFDKNSNFINFNIPNIDESIFIFKSGYGEGYYPAYFGYNHNGVIASLVIQLIDIEQAYEIDS